MMTRIGMMVAAMLMLISTLAFGADEPVDSKVQVGLTLFEMMAPVITALLAWLSVRTTAWIKAKTKNERLAGILARANDLLWTLVKESKQTVVDGLKAAKKAGSPGGEDILQSELAKVREDVIDDFKELWGAAGLAELGKILGLDEDMLDRWIESRVEAAVHDLKRDPQQPTP